MFFQFEADFVESLRCIPMQVRLKLDTCGVKLKLNQWNTFTQGDRQQLVDRPCTTPAEAQAYRDWLQALLLERTGEAASDLAISADPAWLNSEIIPDTVQARAAREAATISPDQWRSLSPLQRFALIKLSRSSHENSNFLPALEEFGIRS